MSYCDFCEKPETKEVHKRYHNQFYGFPIENDDELFGRFIMEINQAGLSWETILNKEENFRKAYSNFSIEKIANYGEEDRARLLSDAGIIRNRLKVDAAIYNAKQILELKKEYRSFNKWLEFNHPKTKDEWVKLFKKHFKFVGGEIVNEFLMSTSYLKGAHVDSCPTFTEILKSSPKWREV